jgi:hypothetical protein
MSLLLLLSVQLALTCGGGGAGAGTTVPLHTSDLTSAAILHLLIIFFLLTLLL